MATTRPRPTRPRTRRRELQRWAQKHEAVIEEVNAAVAALTTSAGALVGVGNLVSIGRATADAERLVAAVRDAQALPPAPDAAAQASFTRVLELWLAGGELQLASMQGPFDAERSAEAGERLAEGIDEFTRFASFFAAQVA